MGVVTYKKFFNVDVKHDFYKSEFSKDISIIPTMETALLLRNNKMVQRPTPNGTRIFYRATGTGTTSADLAPYTPLDAATFVFTLELSNKAEFLNVTNLNDTSPVKEFTAGNIVRFWNSPQTTLALNYEILDMLRPNAFVFDFKLTTMTGIGDIKVEVKDAGGATVIPISGPLTAVNGVFSYKVDLSEEPKGKYQLVVTDTNNGTTNNNKTYLAYIDSDLASKDIFGILEISTPASAVPATFDPFVGLGNFFMQFVRRSSTWKYFIINKTNNINFGTNSFDIEQISPYDNTSVYTGSPYEFLAPTTETPINGMATVSIESQDPIPFFEESIARLKLKTGPTPWPPTPATTIINNLPNPTRYTVSSDPTDYSITYIYVYV